MSDEDADDRPELGIWKTLLTLPLFDQPYLGMQALNLEVVDHYLDDMEARLLAEYMEEERTPLETTVFVSALSQLWIFGLYELLRTWRQRAVDVLRWDKAFRAAPLTEREGRREAKKREIEKRSAQPGGTAVFYWPAYERAAADPAFAASLRRAVDRTERLFRRIEALRMFLAKHELPGVKGSFTMAPGYGRIDMLTGSIYWQVALRGNEVDMISRRGIADDCRRLVRDSPGAVLAEHIQDMVRKLPDHSYGVKRISVVLDDGAEFEGIYVAWAKEIVLVEGHDSVPFDVTRIVKVQHDPEQEADEVV